MGPRNSESSSVEKHKHRLIHETIIRRRLGPDVQGKAVFVLRIVVVGGELVVDSEAIASEVRERGHRRDVCRAVTISIARLEDTRVSG
jgi:hypothetical protein